MPTNLKRHDELGHVHFLTVSCYRRLPFFLSASVRDEVVDCMKRARERLGFRWIGYVIMPEHVHWLIYPQISITESNQQSTQISVSERLIPVSRVLESLKTSIGRRVKAKLRVIWTSQRSLGHVGLDRWATSRSDTKPIWTTRGIDFNITSEHRLRQKLDYCHKNPLVRGLANRAELWRWSSYGYYQGHADAPLAMDWNGAWPMD